MNNTSNPPAPEVSVIIPTYNDAIFLEKALSSVLEQTFQNWEAIVVDNTSCDNTIEVINTFNDRRIKTYSIKNHGVIAASRNFAVQKSNAKYIAFLDSDDFWFPTKLEVGVKKMDEGYDLFCHAEEWFDEHSRVKQVAYGPKKSANYKSLLYFGNKISTSATIVRRFCLNEVGGFSENPKYITVEDYDLWMRIAEKTSKFVFTNEVLGTYRVHAKGSSRFLKSHRLAEFNVVRNHHSKFLGKNHFLFSVRVLRILIAFVKDVLKNKILKTAL